VRGSFVFEWLDGPSRTYREVLYSNLLEVFDLNLRATLDAKLAATYHLCRLNLLLQWHRRALEKPTVYAVNLSRAGPCFYHSFEGFRLTMWVHPEFEVFASPG